MNQLIQALGSLMILVPFVLAQTGRMPMDRVPYQTFNLVGSTVLAIDAGVTRQWGFLLLEGVWAIASFVGVIRRIRPSARRKYRSVPEAQEHEEQGLSQRPS